MTGAFTMPNQSSSGDVPLFETEAWQSGTPRYGEQLLLRRAAPGDGVLLLKHSHRERVYRYDPRTRAFAPAAEQEWTRAEAPIEDCGKQVPPAPPALRIDSPTNRLMAGARAIATAGPTVLDLTMAPSARVVAVLSAARGKQPSLLPSLGASASGQRYHQIVSLPDAVIHGKAVRVPVRRDNDVLESCWSADERAIVYYNVLFSYVAVVDAVF